MGSRPSMCTNPQAEWLRENEPETHTQIPRQAMAETQRDWTGRGSEGDTGRRETGVQRFRGTEKQRGRETQAKRQSCRDRGKEIGRAERQLRTQ